MKLPEGDGVEHGRVLESERQKLGRPGGLAEPARALLIGKVMENVPVAGTYGACRPVQNRSRTRAIACGDRTSDGSCRNSWTNPLRQTVRSACRGWHDDYDRPRACRHDSSLTRANYLRRHAKLIDYS